MTMAMASVAAAASHAAPHTATATGAAKGHDLCAQDRFLCTETYDSEDVFGHYVGHDEPSLLFYSNRAGSGNQMQYRGIIPRDPPSRAIPGKRSYNFMLYPATWFGMAMCDTQSYPETVKTCPPDSNRNITKPGSPISRRNCVHGTAVLPAGLCPAVQRLQLLGHPVVRRTDH